MGHPGILFCSALGSVEWVGASRHLRQNLGSPSAEALGYFRDAPPGLAREGRSPSCCEDSHRPGVAVFLARLNPYPSQPPFATSAGRHLAALKFHSFLRLSCRDTIV